MSAYLDGMEVPRNYDGLPFLFEIKYQTRDHGCDWDGPFRLLRWGIDATETERLFVILFQRVFGSTLEIKCLSFTRREVDGEDSRTAQGA